mmetsp:Transcript_71362/g.155006  ORF Transcript_71362/g.155006 Transcript_71362/m.155006 type:complete len:214 (-) Transcript_71362:357-998(-)
MPGSHPGSADAAVAAPLRARTRPPFEVPGRRQRQRRRRQQPELQGRQPLRGLHPGDGPGGNPSKRFVEGAGPLPPGAVVLAPLAPHPAWRIAFVPSSPLPSAFAARPRAEMSEPASGRGGRPETAHTQQAARPASSGTAAPDRACASGSSARCRGPSRQGVCFPSGFQPAAPSRVLVVVGRAGPSPEGGPWPPDERQSLHERAARPGSAWPRG